MPYGLRGSYLEMQRSAVYRFSHACKLTAFSGAETSSSSRAKFLLPEISKLSTEVKSGSLAMLLLSCGMTLFASLVKFRGRVCSFFVYVGNNVLSTLQLISPTLKELILLRTAYFLLHVRCAFG